MNIYYLGPRSIGIALLAAIWFLLSSVGGPMLAFGQKLEKSDPRIAPGKLVVEGTNKIPTSPWKLLSYRLEEVTLPEPIELDVRGKRLRLIDALRLTITSQSIQGAHVIWVDDASLPAVFGLGENAIGVLIYDRSILKDGAVISVSDHLGRSLYELPERLRLPESLKAAIKPVVAQPGDTYRVYSSLRIAGFQRQRLINFEFTTNWGFQILNLSYIVQIGKKFFPAGTIGYQASFTLTPEEFAQLRDGDMIAIGYGGPILNHSGWALWEFGPLEKSRLDR